MVTFAQLYGEAWRAAPGARAELRRSVLHEVALELTERAGLSPELLAGGRLARHASPLDDSLRALLPAFAWDGAGHDRHELAHRLGQTLDALLALESGFERQEAHTTRKKSGSFFTPPRLARALVERSRPYLRSGSVSRVCDPAVGGGAFLLEAARLLVEIETSAGRSSLEARRSVAASLHGFDKDELPVWVSEVALWLSLSTGGEPLVENPRLIVRDSLCREEAAPPTEFDWIVGNPPWVAFQGRAARPLTEKKRAYYRENYRAFRGYPTLQGMFVERACELSPRGVVSLLLPSSVSDLDGYRATRARLRETHEPREPLEEYGQDAFQGVVQPCFGLVATPFVAQRGPSPTGAAEPWRLEERARRGQATASAGPPPAIARLLTLPQLAARHFGELGLQTNSEVSERLLLRAERPAAPYLLPLLEGRRVQEFRCQPPALFLHPEREILERTRCLVRSAEAYARVDFVVRQTAAYPIAAAHPGGAFRNSLLAGYASDEIDTALLVGLLNSALYRAIHLAGQRDARQAVFPQVKVSHLRRLPQPPEGAALRALVRKISEAATNTGQLAPSERVALDDAVFGLFGLDADEAEEVRGFLEARAPTALSGVRSRVAERSPT